ncbi:MAG TPA: tRNA (guanine(46)-N(7))-methyltransferase TrmB [Xanthobacteraceae bacterium]|nr:tRNA (guanine(46)-N(7))-methyltransferase TrmB [Xanthobacteraceae bacterium]
MRDVDPGTDGRRGFFGRRKGHRLRSHQSRLLETLLPVLALELERPAPSTLATLYPVAVEEVRLEIGFGGGEHLVAAAEASPKTGFIGCEPFVNGMAKALAAIDERRLRNIRLHHGDAVAALEWLPAQSLAGIDLLYPDPWPKRRHWKRRFVQDERIVEFSRVLRSDAVFRFATDSSDYAAWTLIRFGRSADFAWTAECADDWQQPWPGFVTTRYEAKALRAGRTPCYLVFRRRQRQDPSSQ